MKQSMSMEEMRALHSQALYDAEAKRTELRLVLSSRYRELVSSSDTVYHMTQRANALQALVQNIPPMIYKLTNTTTEEEEEHKEDHQEISTNTINNNHNHSQVQQPHSSITHSKTILSVHQLLRTMYRALDDTQLYTATISLLQIVSLRHLLSSVDSSFQEKRRPWCHSIRTVQQRQCRTIMTKDTFRRTKDPTSILPSTTATSSTSQQQQLQTLFQMIDLQIQTVPDQIRRLAYQTMQLCHSATTTPSNIRRPATSTSTAALLALYLLHERTDVTSEEDEEDDKEEEEDWSILEQLITTYYQCKATLISSLLNQLSTTNNTSSSSMHHTTTVDTTHHHHHHQNNHHHTIHNAEQILIQIVQILQQDIIVHPYWIFLQPPPPPPPTSTTTPTKKNVQPDAISLFQHIPLLLLLNQKNQNQKNKDDGWSSSTTMTRLQDMLKMKCSKYVPVCVCFVLLLL